MLLGDLRDAAVGARKADGQLVAEPERGVVVAIERDRHDRQARPLGELRGDEPGGDVRRDLVLVHGDDHPSVDTPEHHSGALSTTGCLSRTSQ
jgi:hypothetical protein